MTDSVNLTPRPDRITSGGIVLLIAEVHLAEQQGTFVVTWNVTGPVDLADQETRVVLLGTNTLADNHVTLRQGDNEIRATLDTSLLTVGSWTVTITLNEVLQGIPEGGRTLEDATTPITVIARPFAAGDDVAVTLNRATVEPTPDQALWVAIRQSTNALDFNSYSDIIDMVMCPAGQDERLPLARSRIALPFPNVDRYRLLKAATEVYLMANVGVDAEFDALDLKEESRRFGGRDLQPGEVQKQWDKYRVGLTPGDEGSPRILPYLGLIRRNLRDVAIVGDPDDEDEVNACQGILARKLTRPVYIELIHSYWLEQAGPLWTIDAIAWRFQNRSSSRSGRDPLAGLDIDPLRPLNNLLWGYVQDKHNRLTATRRDFEYAHAYGLSLDSNQGADRRGADSRTRFVEAFHNLLALCSVFYEDDDNTMIVADAYGVMHAIKEVHLLLSQGAGNQYGDLPWTARHEMLMSQWILARPELREFLGGRTTVVYPEQWMGRVEAMNRLQGWSDISVQHLRDLAVFGEQLLLGIRFGAWTNVFDSDHAANWARYWRPEVMAYTHAYRAVTGMNLNRRTDKSASAVQLRQRNGARVN